MDDSETPDHTSPSAKHTTTSALLSKDDPGGGSEATAGASASAAKGRKKKAEPTTGGLDVTGGERVGVQASKRFKKGTVGTAGVVLVKDEVPEAEGQVGEVDIGGQEAAAKLQSSMEGACRKTEVGLETFEKVKVKVEVKAGQLLCELKSEAEEAGEGSVLKLEESGLKLEGMGLKVEEGQGMDGVLQAALLKRPSTAAASRRSCRSGKGL